METKIECRFHRRHSTNYYLLTLFIGEQVNVTESFPQARAVVDDFGNLQIIRGWL